MDFSSLKEEEIKGMIATLQGELESREANKRADAWKKAKQALDEYLRLGGSITVSWFNEVSSEGEEFTGDRSDINITNDANIILDNF